jgi:Mrp family chromosome partitioning ATPase
MSQVETGSYLSAAFAHSTSVSGQATDPLLAKWLTPESPDFEVFRILRTKIKSLDEQRALRCFGMVGATRGEGVTTVALGLATALALDASQRVLVIEASLREPRLERALGLAAAPGLSEWLESGDAAPPVLRRIEPWGFWLLAAGAPVMASAEALSSPRMAQLLAGMRQAFTYVVIDCPAFESVADSLVLQDLLDGFLLVVRARHASRDTLRRAFGHLRRDSVRGVVLNDRAELLTRWLDRRPRRRA